MTIKVESTKDIYQLVIEDEMTIYTAAILKEELLGHLSRCQVMEINLKSVSEMDCAGLQIMLMLEHEAKRIGKEVSFVHHSQPVIDVLELLNLGAHFGDPIVFLAAEASS